MVRRLPLTFGKVLGNFCVLTVIAVISSIYYSVMSTEHSAVFLLTFHFFLLMLIWSFIQAMTTDPGPVPALWGFHMDNTAKVRKRYCLVCHVFKPERCHHCSVCNRCVLNMDHHCPWLNNCVGFFNKKHFLLLLFYVIITSNIVAVGLFPTIYQKISFLIDHRGAPDLRTGFLIGIYLFNIILSFLISIFSRFHLKMLISNETTLENLDKPKVNPYDSGWRHNFLQVFGSNPWLWLLPVTGSSGKPIGNGVTWFNEELKPAVHSPSNSGQTSESENNRTAETLSSPKRAISN